VEILNNDQDALKREKNMFCGDKFFVNNLEKSNFFGKK